MLEHLHIRNLALIEDMSLDFSNGINVLTGETGAGKSFILKALGFVLGDKLSADIVRPGAERAQVEALFNLAGKDLILRRELVANTGRSRFYINDALSSQETLRDLRNQLISHTSQHAQQQLLQPAFQTRLLEKGLAQSQLLVKRDELLDKLKKIATEINELKIKQGTLAEKREFLEMQKAEIDKIAPEEGEEEELEEARAKARAFDEQKQNYNNAITLLHGDDGPGILDLLADFERLLSHMAREETHWQNGLECVAALRGELARMANEFRRPPDYAEKVDIDAIEKRLFEFAQLKRKLKRTMPQIFELKEEIQNNLSFLDVCNLDLGHLAKEQKKLESELEEIVNQIRPLRRKSADEFARALEIQLKDLGFSEHVKIQPDFTSQQIWPGIDDERCRIFWAPNPGQNAQPLDKIASGGELSRFLLGMNTLSTENEDLTFIFDEVDAGVGGLTLNKVADKLQNLASSHQIILITHWPQLAARANKHFQITKTVKDNNTFTQCFPLEGEARKKELSRMAGGGNEGNAMAKNLLA